MTIDAIHCGDCLGWMKGMADDSVDLVICSPPYSDARTYGIDFALKGQSWVDWAIDRFVECARVCRGLVAWVVEGRTKNFRWTAEPALLMADLHRRGVQLRKPPAYCRVGIPGGGGPDWWRNDYEFVVCASKGKLPWSDATANGKSPKYGPGGPPSHRKVNGERVGRKVMTRDRPGTHSQKSTVYVPPALANAGNLLRVKVGGGLMGSALAHLNEACYPEALVEPFVLCFCPPGGVVLDCFAGSGTTLAVAKRLGRHWLGCDIRQSQVDLAYRRLDEVQVEMFA